MAINNLHISLTEFRNESRILKEVASIINHGVADHVYIAALKATGQPIEDSISPKISVQRVALYSRKLPKNLVVQLVKYLEFCVRVLLDYRSKEIKIVNVHSVSLLPLGVLCKYLYKSSLIYDTHELETEKEGELGVRQKLSKWMERFLIGYCDKVFVVGEEIADWYRNAYAISRPIVIMNCPHSISVEPSNIFRKHFGISEDTKILLYQGRLTSGRGIELLIQAFSAPHRNDIAIIFMGYGPIQQFVKEAAAKHKAIYFHDAVDPSNVLSYTAAADIGVSLIQNTCLSYYYSMPNKLFEYAMAGLPVITSNMIEAAGFVIENNIGVVTRDESVEALYAAIDQIMSMDLDLLSANAIMAGHSHSWQAQEQKMIPAYKALLGTTA